MTNDEMLAGIARSQHGLVERSQAVALGLTSEMIQTRLDRGSFERVLPRVYRVSGSPATPEQRLLAACLSAGPGAVASHRAAAALWGMDGPFAGETEITIPRRKAPRLRNATAHCSTDLGPDDITERSGIPVTKPARTLVDLGAVCPRWIVDRAIDSVLARRLETIEGLWQMLVRVARKGRSGAGVLRECLEWRFGVPDSVLEAIFLRIVRDHDLPIPEVQYEVVVGGRTRRIDAAYPAHLLAIELDGAAKRMSPDALHDDLARQNDLVAAGFTVLRFGFPHLTRQQAKVAGQVRALLAQRAPRLLA